MIILRHSFHALVSLKKLYVLLHRSNRNKTARITNSVNSDTIREWRKSYQRFVVFFFMRVNYYRVFYPKQSSGWARIFFRVFLFFCFIYYIVCTHIRTFHCTQLSYKQTRSAIVFNSATLDVVLNLDFRRQNSSKISHTNQIPNHKVWNNILNNVFQNEKCMFLM